MAAKILLPLIFILSLLSFSSSHRSSTSLTRAADILSNAGYLSMSLTLQLVPKTLMTTSSSHSLTIFSPSDSAFASSGQPSLSLLRFHFSPHTLSLHSLKSLPFNSKIPTLFPNHSLIVTSSPSIECNVSINGVKITHKPIYDDRSLVIFGIDKFFNPGYRVLGSFESPHRNLGCGVSSFNKTIMSVFEDANEVLRSKGHSFMASFLELQLLGFKDKSSGVDELTVFAPVDRVMMDYVGNVSDYSSLFLRHVVPCKFLWSDLVGLDDHEVVELRTFLDGFKINVTRSDDDDDVFMINGVVISLPNLYFSDWLVIHGIGGVLELPAKDGAEPSSEMGSDSDQEIAPHHGEF